MSKVDWSKVPESVKRTKIENRKSKRDIIRENKIKEAGGEPVVVVYGKPLSDKIRQERMEYFWNLLYPDRLKAKPRRGKRPKLSNELTLEKYFLETFRFRKRRAIKKGLEFTIKPEDVILTDKCPIFGTEFTYGETLSDTTLTIDRLDSKKGYVPGNVVVISHKANRIKNDANLNELEKVVHWLKNLQTQ
jgi:hypothetical protein